MTSVDPGSTARAPLFGRIKNILMQPREEWPRIAAEPETIAALYTSYIIPVAIIVVLLLFRRKWAACASTGGSVSGDPRVAITPDTTSTAG